jgi:hypothetical protein
MFIVDVQGFQYGANNFICKEIAIINTINGKSDHAILKLPFDKTLFNHRTEKQWNWLTNNLHGLQWDGNWYCNINYENLLSFIENFINNDNNDNDNKEDIVVAVKGAQKKEWLSTLLNREIIDLEEDDYPAFSNLKEIFKSFHCQKHYFNNLSCSLENVYNLYYLCNYCRK